MSPEQPKQFPEVLPEELAEMRARRAQLFPHQQPLPADAAVEHEFSEAHKMRPFGLAFSGGGIRSATFNLGVLQGMSKAGLLPYVDYLSTVSGGGYIGSWLHGVIQHKHKGDPAAAGIDLDPAGVPGEAEQDPVTFLRKYSNYLAPRVGLFSPDFWTITAVWARNMALNLLILIPFLAGIVLTAVLCGMVQQAYGSHRFAHWTGTMRIGFAYRHLPWVLPMLLAVILIAMNLQRVMAEVQGKRVFSRFDCGSKRVILGTVLLVMAASYSIGVGRFNPRNRLADVALFFLFLLLQLLGGFPSCFKARHGGGLRSALFWLLILAIPLVCAAVTAALLAVVCDWTRTWNTPETQWRTLAFGPPLVVLVWAAGITLQIGLMGADFHDAAREWLARLSALLSICVVLWTGLFWVSIFGPYWVTRMTLWYLPAGLALAGGWIASAAGGYISGKSERTSGGPLASHTDTSGWTLELIGKVAPAIFMTGFLLAASTGAHLLVRTLAAGEFQTNAGCLTPAPPAATVPQWLRWLVPVQQDYWCVLDLRGDVTPPKGQRVRPLAYLSSSGVFLVAGEAWLGCLVLILLLPLRFNINEFSMHHFYKNRLVRCYLGAGKADSRQPNRLTGFDPHDDYTLDELRGSRQYLGPYPIVNCALNLNAGSELAKQERRGSSFVFTPLYCGFEAPLSRDDRQAMGRLSDLHEGGYRATVGYVEPAGPGLGMALAISGAAANPNSGYHTSAPLAFLLTIFDVRLGWWLGNPRRDGPSKRPGPANALVSLLAELFAQTNGRSRYVNVSDGGHFENLGLYELVRRRCRYIIACDAEEDGGYKFEGLGGAIRKCRTDFGVEITLDPAPIRLSGNRSGAHCVVGTITYPEKEAGYAAGVCGGARCAEANAQGWILYLKSSLTGDEPADVQQYQAGHDTFPHETTADQFFTESQFESYRQLGLHIFNTAFENVHRRPSAESEAAMLAMFQDLCRTWFPAPAAPGSSAGNLTDRYSALMQRLSQDSDLQFLDQDFFPGMPSPAPPTDDKILRKGILYCGDLIQLMEDVYNELDLERRVNRSNPHYEGWLGVFRRLTKSATVLRAWELSRSGYGPMFQDFFEEVRDGKELS